MNGMRSNGVFGNWAARKSLRGAGLASALKANVPQVSRRVVGI